MSLVVVRWQDGGNGNQQVFIKKLADSTWVGGPIVPAEAKQAAVDVLPNYIYNFKVVDTCEENVKANSSVITSIWQTCPNVSLYQVAGAVHYEFTHLGGDITKYVVQLLDSFESKVIDSHTINSPSGIIKGSFLTGDGVFKIKVSTYAGNLFEYSKGCPSKQIAVNSALCKPPSSVVVSIETISEAV